MSSAPTPQEIWKDARWLAQAVDPNAGLVRVVEMGAADYREASFLDDRILAPSRPSHLLKWSEVADAKPADAREDARWIFHIGHVGSTLVSRLLGEMDSVLAVREPRALRDLTFFPPDVRRSFVPRLRALMSRTFEATGTAVVKATSMVSEIASELVGEQGRALFFYASPTAYLQTILAGERSQAELQTLASYYSARAKGRGIAWQEPSAPADVAALVWACEMTALENAAATLSDGCVLWQDFDAFLEDPSTGLNTVACHLGLATDGASEIASGPLMNRYSKATEHEFGPAARRQLLTDAAVRHAGAIRTALALLNQAAEKAPVLARALARSTTDH